MFRIKDKRLHEQLVKAEREDLRLLHKEISDYLRFWQIAADEPEAPVTHASRH